MSARVSPIKASRAATTKFSQKVRTPAPAATCANTLMTRFACVSAAFGRDIRSPPVRKPHSGMRRQPLQPASDAQTGQVSAHPGMTGRSQGARGGGSPLARGCGGEAPAEHSPSWDRAERVCREDHAVAPALDKDSGHSASDKNSRHYDTA